MSNEKKQKLKKYQKTIVKLQKAIFYGFNNVCYEFQSYAIKSEEFMPSIKTIGYRNLIMFD